MTLVHRTGFEIDQSGFGADPFETQEIVWDVFKEWLSEYNKNLRLPVEPGKIESDNCEVSYGLDELCNVVVARFSLIEIDTNHNGQWITSLTSLINNDLWGTSNIDFDHYCWVDVEWTTTDPTQIVPPFSPPTLTKYVIEGISWSRVGGIQTSPEPNEISQTGVPEFVELLNDPERQIPFVVVAEDRYEEKKDAEARCLNFYQSIMGFAPVFFLNKEATSAFADSVGTTLSLEAGSIRCYMNGPEPLEENPRRHKKIPRELYVKDPQNTAKRVIKILNPLALKRPLPDIYINEISILPGFPNYKAPGDEDLLEEAIDLEAEVQRLTAEVESLTNDLDFAFLSQDESEQRLSDAQARIEFLRKRLEAFHDLGAHEMPPTPAIPPKVDSCREAVSNVRQFLDLVEIGDTNEAVGELDGYQQSSIWANKAWQGFRTLEIYARSKNDDNFNGNLYNFCVQPPNNCQPLIPEHWVAMQEGANTDEDPQRYGARLFPVPENVNKEGQVYMCAHLKLEQGGYPAPRIHFYDDTSGPTGKIFVGYFGKHLP